MQPLSSMSSGNRALSRSASNPHRQLAQHAHLFRHGIRCPAPTPLQNACYSTATRRQPAVVLSHASERTCSLSSISWPLQSQHTGSSHSSSSSGSSRPLMLRGFLQRPSRQSGSSAKLAPRRLATARSSSGGGQSMDDDEEGDAGVTRELEGCEVERFRQMGRHLDLMWNVGKKPRPAPCDCCEGSGCRNCGYCNSTGAMMVGHERFCSLEQGCKPCPICNGTGEVKCSHCQGTGYRAGWLERGCPVEQ